MSPGRNPRRAYDKDGNDIPPVTVGSDRAAGLTIVAVVCDPCGHDAEVPLALSPDNLPVPDIALKVLCSAFRGRT